MQQVEVHKDILIIPELYLRHLSHLPVELSLVGQLLTGQLLVEARIDVAHLRPQTHETLFQLGVVIVGEIAEKPLDHCLLVVIQIAHAIQLVKVSQIGKDAAGVGHVLVEVVEISQQQLSPAIEVVERLVDAGHLDKAAVQLADQAYGIGYGHVGMVTEQVADGDIGGTPDGASGLTGQVVVQEKRCTLVGEHHSHTCQMVSVLAQDVCCHIFQERLAHSFTSCIWLE